MIPDMKHVLCPKCAGEGFVNNGPMCRHCEGKGKLAAEITYKESTMTSKQVLDYVIANWSLFSSAVSAGFASYVSTSNTKTALIAFAAYLFGHATVKSPAVASFKAAIKKRVS